MVHNEGLLVAVGITDWNVQCMKDGEAMTLPLGRLLAESVKEGDISPGEVSLMVAYGESHVAIVDAWNEQLRQSGITLPDVAMEDAARLDAELRAKGLM